MLSRERGKGMVKENGKTFTRTKREYNQGMKEVGENEGSAGMQ